MHGPLVAHGRDGRPDRGDQSQGSADRDAGLAVGAVEGAPEEVGDGGAAGGEGCEGGEGGWGGGGLLFSGGAAGGVGGWDCGCGGGGGGFFVGV